MKPEDSIHQLFQKIGQTVANYSFLGKGEASNVYKVTTDKGVFAVKTALYPERKKKIINEANIRSFFIENGLDCIPPPIYSDESIFPYGAVIYDFVEGTKPSSFSNDNIKQFARIISKIHQINYEVIEHGYTNIEKLFTFFKETINKISTKYTHLVNTKIKSAFELAILEFEDMLPKESDYNSIAINAQLHGDLSDNFVIDSNDKVWLLDGENSEFGDIADEICWFFSVTDISEEQRAIFVEEYQTQFPVTKGINFERLFTLYFASNIVLNICWGIDQLDMNIRQKLEPERKLRDLKISANEWGIVLSKKAYSLINDGINQLISNLQNE
ncbi:MAG: aminoglycoside phosphotransferase family protein [Asgard group archaeon]|nr:aminoglycoside phosphotransferase family protein [Asgard group archaeon]